MVWCVVERLCSLLQLLHSFASQMVFEQAEATAAKYHERMEAERKAREEAAKDIVMGLGEDLDAPFSASSDLEQILSSEPEAPAPEA